MLPFYASGEGKQFYKCSGMRNLDGKQIFDETQQFLNEYQLRYLQLLNLVKRYLEDLFAADSAGMETVYRIYSRKDCPGQISEIKNVQSLSDKLIRLKKENPPAWNRKALQVHDIVGCRVVVYYRHQMEIVVDKIRNTTKSRQLRIEDDEYSNRYGYHAHHLVVSSQLEHLRDLLCEIQVKTVLHDAWGAKTHSFTYKPRGEVTPFDIRMMQSFGDSVEALEVQSELLRLRRIEERETAKLGQRARVAGAARKAMLAGLARKQFDSPALTESYKSVHDRITNFEQLLASCRIDDSTLTLIVNDIADIKHEPNGLEPAFTLMLLLASMRENSDLNYITIQYLEEWIALTGKQGVEAAFWRSSVLYTIGERDAAITTIREYLSSSGAEFDWNLKFNLLNYLIESAIQTAIGPSTVREECDKLIAELDLSAMTDENTRYSAVQDTLGAYLIAFGQYEDEIETGIAMCRNAYGKDSEDKAGIAFGKLHERMGWSKLLM